MMSILYWLAWAFLPILIVALAVWWLSRKVTKRLGWRLFAVAMVPVVAFWDVIPTQIAFNRLCEKEGGLKIYRTVEDVHGIAVLPLINDCIEFCVDYLVEKGYDFVEGGIGRSLDYKKWEKFRYWLAPATDPACQRRLPSPLITKWDFEKEAALNARLGGNCIARKSIPPLRQNTYISRLLVSIQTWRDP